MTKMYYNGQIVDVDESALKNRTYNDIAPVQTTQDIAPVNQKKKKKKKFNLDDWIELSNFKDGYDFGDVTKTILGTGTKVSQNFTKGAQSNLEGMIDAGANYLSMGTEKLGMKKATKDLRKFAQEDFIDKHDLVDKALINVNPVMSILNQGIKTKEKLSDGYNFGDIITSIPSADLLGTEKSTLSKKMDKMAENSITGIKTDELTQTVGQIAGQSALTSVGLPWQLTAFASSAGNEMNEAFQNNATASQAFVSGLISGVAEVGSEYIGFGGDKLLGMESLGGKAISKLGSKISNKVLQYVTKMGLGAVSEGLEEVLSGYGSALGKKLTYMSDKELNEIYSNEEALDEFVMGALGTLVTNIPGTARSIARGENAFTGLTENEQTVLEEEVQRRTEQESKGKELTQKQIDKIREGAIKDFQRGYIDANQIEKTLGEKYNPEKDIMLNESFAERGRRTENYKVEDLSKYSKSEQKIIKKAMDSGLLNNSNRTHDFVDLLAKLASDKKMDFDFTNNERLAKSSFALKGKTIDGFVDGNKVTLNLESNKALNKVVGHEITHILEGTDLYTELQNSLKSYIGEREWNSRISELEERYKDVKNAKVENELTSDLVGDYIFNDESFIRSLSTKNPNAFQKIYNEIKYMLNLATAGSKEARELEKAKHTFEKLYRENKTIENKQKLAISEGNEIEMAKRLNKELTQAKSNLTKKENAFKMANSEEYTYQDENFAPEVAKAHRAELREKTTKAHEEYVEAQERLEKAQKAVDDFKNEMTKGLDEDSPTFSLSENVSQESKTKYSLTKDNQGRELSKEQQEFFKDSKATDENGNLLVLYHGTPSGGFNEFDMNFRGTTTDITGNGDYGKGFYFTPNEKYAQRYSENDTYNKGNKQVYQVYLDMKNPLRLDVLNDISKGGFELIKEYGWENTTEEMYDKLYAKHGLTREEFEQMDRAKWMLEDNWQDVEISDLGYDGVINENRSEFIVFNSNQIKNVDNTNPTSNPDIRYSLSNDSKVDSQGRELTIQQQEYFKDSKIRDEKGKLIPVYHGSNSEFTVFDITKSGESSKEAKVGFWFTPSKQGAENFANEVWYGDKKPTTYEVYLDVKNPKIYETYEVDQQQKDNMLQNMRNLEQEIKNSYQKYSWTETEDYKVTTLYNDLVEMNKKKIKGIQDEYNEDFYRKLAEERNISNEKFNEMNQDAKHQVDLEEQNRKASNDYHSYIFSDGYEQFRTDLYLSAGMSAEDANVGGLGMMIKNENEAVAKFVKELKEEGYDGIVIKNTKYDASTMGGENTQYVAFYPNQIKNVDNTNPTDNPDIRYSLSVEEANTTQDNEGRKLNDNQLAYFKDSKAVDENGNLITVFHTMTNTGEQFNEFNPVGTEGYRFGDQVVNFYTNSQVMSDSYANYKSTKADTSKLSSIEDAKTWLTKQNTLFDEYNIKKSKGDGYYITSNGQAKQTLQFENENDLLKNIKQRFYEYNKQFGSSKGQAKYQYEGYVNITNPYIIDAKEANWDNILTGYDDIAYRYAKEIDNNTKEQLIEMAKESKRLAEISSNNWWEAQKELGSLRNQFIPVDKSLEELKRMKRGETKEFKELINRAIQLKEIIENEENSPYKYEDSYFRDNVQEIMDKLNEEQNMNYSENELYKMALADFVDESLIDTFGTTSSTNEIIKSVLNKNKLGENYDGVIIKNVMDYGTDGAAFDVDGVAQDVYVTFNSNQFKAVDNLNPTSDADIRYSLSNQNEISPTSDWNVRGQDIALKDAIAPIQEKLDQLSKTLDEVKLGMSSNEEFNLDDVTFDDDLANFNPEDINLAPFLEGTENTEDNRLLEGLEKAEDYKNKRKELKKQIEEKRSTYIAKDANKGKGWRSFLRLFENEFAPIDNLAKTRKNPSIKHKADTYNNWVALANSNMTNSQTDINGKPIGRSGNSIINQAQKLGLLDVLDTYVKHWSNIDRARQGKGGADFSSKESYKIIKQIEADHPQIKKIASDVWNYFRNARHNLKDAGIINEDLSKRLGRMYPHYVPYVSENVQQYFTENGELKPVKTIKSAKGGAVIGDLLSLQEAMQRYTYSEFKGIKFNELAKEIIKSSNDEVRLEPDTRTSYVDVDQLYVDPEGYYLTAYENGEPLSTRINQEIYDTLNRTLTNQVKDLEKQWSGITKPLQFLSKLKKNLVTKWSLTFPATNAIKDAGDAVFNSKYTKDYIKHYNPMSLYELATNQGDAPQFKNLYGVANDMGTYNVDSGLFEANKNAKNFNFLKGVENVNELIELLPRYAEYKASLDNGCSIEEAMYNAREVTTNFSRGGIITKALNRNGIPFLNPSVQGFSKFIRNFSGENGAKGIVNSLAKATIFGIAPAIFNDLAFGSGDDKDEDYEALPDYIKDNYYLIKMSNGEFIRIPKGRMISIFGSASRRALEYMNGEEDAFDGFLKNIDSQIGINNPEENNLLAPILQAYGSKNGEAWYGGDIVPTRLQDVPEAEQYDASTDNLSIWLGEKTGLSPYKLNYILDQYSGGIGDIVLPMMTEETTNGAETIGDYLLAPISDKFIVNSTTDNKYVSDFYSTNEKLNTQANSMYATDEDILKKDYMNSISKQMSQLYAERRAIQSDTTLSNKEKFAKSQAIKDEINKLAKEGINGYENIDITGNYAEINDDVSYYKNANGKWTSINDEDMLATAGLSDLQKSKYYDVKNDLYEVNKEYSEKYENATEAERSVLSTQKKQDTINIIKQSGLPDDVKANIYQKKYNDKLIDSLVDIGVDVNKYLDFKAQTFTADKNKNGKTISGSKKRKVFDYINQMNIPVAQKAILLKSQYNTFNTYNYEILEYIQKSNLSYDEKMELLKKIGFKIDGNQVSW